jgi:hypothetical protein
MPSDFHFQEPTLRPAKYPVPPRPELPLLVRAFWPTVYGLIVIVLLLMAFLEKAYGGGPQLVAGSSYFDAGTKGTPLSWNPGSIVYYTDQNDLSPLLPHATADAFVTDAFSRWTGISTAAVSATLAGQLAEDVNGTNVFVNADGSITLPADILPSVTTKPVAIVYDNGGAVTDALLGQGASDPLYCYTNAVFGGPDNLTTSAHIAHALVVLNGNCVQTSAQLPDVKYMLVRTLGRVLGLGWSQANLNVITGHPAPKPEDYAGFTIMHAQEVMGCVPVSACFPNADQPKMDDRAALSRLYPVTAQNISGFPGKQLFFENTIRLHGSVRFVDSSGVAAQPMQGVNVVARWMDPSSGKPSGTSVATSVTGFLFRGNAGNPVNGPDQPSSGQRYDRFGSDDTTVEGFFDLAGLEIPNGASSAQYQITTEALDPLWSQAVEPYGPFQVQPSGAVQPILVTVSKGGDSQQDLLMLGSAQQQQETFGPEDYANPAPVPVAGDWLGSLSGYGDSDYFWFNGQGNRTMSVEVSALDAQGLPSTSQAQPVIGVWGISDPPGNPAPANTPGAFNSSIFGMTRLDATLLAASGFRIGIADFRGDGRPDYRYHARVLYGDTTAPNRASVKGGSTLAIDGLGFRTGLAVAIGGVNAPVVSQSSNQMIVNVPARPDGLQSILINDATTGSTSTMTDAVTYGAGPNDLIRLIAGTNPPTPIGAEAANAIRIAVFGADNMSPVAGASVSLTAAPAVAFTACGGASSCTVLSDDSGAVSTRITPLTLGTSTITASLAPASYNPPKIVQTPLVATSSALDLGAVSPYQYLALGATLDVPLSARVLSNGAPLSGKSVTFQIVSGSGTLNPATVNSDSMGYANTTLHVTTLAASLQVFACVEPGDKPCQSFYVNAMDGSLLSMQAVSGGSQRIAGGQSFQPVVFRVIDPAGDVVRGAAVAFSVLISRPQRHAPVIWLGDGIIGRQPAPVILASTQSVAVSDGNGIVSLTPTTAGFAGPLILQGTASAGPSAASFQLETFAGQGGFRGMGPKESAGTVHGMPEE